MGGYATFPPLWKTFIPSRGCIHCTPALPSNSSIKNGSYLSIGINISKLATPRIAIVTITCRASDSVSVTKARWTFGLSSSIFNTRCLLSSNLTSSGETTLLLSWSATATLATFATLGTNTALFVAGVATVAVASFFFRIISSKVMRPPASGF